MIQEALRFFEYIVRFFSNGPVRTIVHTVTTYNFTSDDRSYARGSWQQVAVVNTDSIHIAESLFEVKKAGVTARSSKHERANA